MIKSLKPLLVFFFLFLSFCSTLSSQTKEKQRIFFEKVYLHVDRDLYFAGDDILFKAYLLNAQVNQLLNTSNNLYVELIAPGAEIVDRKVIRLNNGLGAGDFKLSDSIANGTYRLRAYTNWMRNFGDNFVFEKQIKVVNDVESKSKPVANANTLNKAVKASLNAKKQTIRFFPEGGSLLENVAGIVAFKAEDAFGKILKVKGVIIASNGDTITPFEAKEGGTGAFLIMPMAGVKYTAKGVFNDKIPFSEALPDALAKGFTTRVTNADSIFKVIVSTNEATLADYSGKQLELRSRHGGVVYSALKFPMDALQKVAEIDKKDFPAGIAAVTLTDFQGKAHSERLLYVDNKNALKVQITTNKPVYKSKERVVVNVKTLDAQDKPVKSEVSLAAVDASIIPEGSGNIVSYFALESELRGKIENPQRYFDPANPNRLKQLDLLLLTQGWRDFVWKRMKDTSITIKNINETGFTISGIVTEKKSDKPLPGINVTLFANGAKGGKLFGQKTNAEGRYFFDNINLEGTQVIKLVATNNEAKKTGKITLDSLYGKPMQILKLDETTPDDAVLATFKTESLNRKEQLKRLSLSDTIELKEVAVRREKTERIFGDVLTSFGYPDQNFTITAKDHDYQSLAHYLLTNVNGAMPSDDPGSNAVTFMNDGKKVRPIFIVDNREDLFDRLDYYELRMNQIEKITVRHMMGNTELDSLGERQRSTKSQHVYVVRLTLKPGAFEKQELSLLNANVKGYYQEKTFYSPVYPAGRVNTKADVRTTVYWHPKVQTDENGSATIYFYSADPKGKVRIVVEGVSLNGQPIVGNSGYEVK